MNTQKVYNQLMCRHIGMFCLVPIGSLYCLILGVKPSNSIDYIFNAPNLLTFLSAGAMIFAGYPAISAITIYAFTFHLLIPKCFTLMYGSVINSLLTIREKLGPDSFNIFESELMNTLRKDVQEVHRLAKFLHNSNLEPTIMDDYKCLNICYDTKINDKLMNIQDSTLSEEISKQNTFIEQMNSVKHHILNNMFFEDKNIIRITEINFLTAEAVLGR